MITTTNNFKESEQCAHDKCSECNGTGRKRNGETCVHFLVCNCSKCSITY